MTATNHVLAGALIGSLLPWPVAIPVAIASHFVMDKIPHFGIDEGKRNKSLAYKAFFYGDAVVALTLGGIAMGLHKWTMLACGFAAYLPDVTFVYYYFRHGQDFNIHHHVKPSNHLTRLHLALQDERPWGLFVELALIAIMTGPFFNRLFN